MPTAPHPSRRSPLRWAIAAVAALAVLASCAGQDDVAEVPTRRAESSARPTTSTTQDAPPSSVAPANGFPEGWTPAALRWAGCPDLAGAECASLEVPLDWDDPSGRTLTLELARTPASGARIGSLLVNPGGPGASGRRFVAARPLGGQLEERFDVVSWDPRGVGASGGLSCGDEVGGFMSLDPEPDDAAEQRALEDAAAEVSAECASEDAEVLAHLGTADVARDLEAIRRALDEGPLNYLGFSYGTQIGQTYAQLFPREVRAMVLDAVVDPASGFEDFLIEQARAFERAFERAADDCAAAGVGRCGVVDLRAAYDELHERLERAPLGSGATAAGPAELVIGSIFTSYSADGWTALGPALAQALDGDGATLRALADAYRDAAGFTAYAAVVCIDTPPPPDVDAYEAFAARAADAAPRFGAATANELLPCATWPVDPVGEPQEIRAPGVPPMLVVGNTGDAATPYENAVAVAERLISGVLVTAEIDGHGATTSNRCVRDVVTAYLVRLQVPPADPRCT